jgi:hypothetical protein
LFEHRSSLQWVCSGYKEAEERIRALSGPFHAGLVAVSCFIIFSLNLEFTASAGVSAKETKCNGGVGKPDILGYLQRKQNVMVVLASLIFHTSQEG